MRLITFVHLMTTGQSHVWECKARNLGARIKIWNKINEAFPERPFLRKIWAISDEVPAQGSAGLPRMAVLQFTFDGGKNLSSHNLAKI